MGFLVHLSKRDTPAKVSLYIKGPPQIKAHLSVVNKLPLLCTLPGTQSLWMYNTAKKTYYSHDMLCSLVVCRAPLSGPDRDRYKISLDQTPFSAFYSLLETPVTLPPPTLPQFFLFLNKVNLMQPDNTYSLRPNAQKMSLRLGSFSFFLQMVLYKLWSDRLDMFHCRLRKSLSMFGFTFHFKHLLNASFKFLPYKSPSVFFFFSSTPSKKIQTSRPHTNSLRHDSLLEAFT